MTETQSTQVDTGNIFSVHNPYWEEVKEFLYNDVQPWHDANSQYPTVQRWGLAERALKRPEFVHKYSWTIPDPDTLLFVASYCNGKIIDPLAGTGYWAYVLRQLSIEVTAYDKEPYDNTWHPKSRERFCTIGQMDAEESVTLYPDHTLMLSWVPYGYPGNNIIANYKGDRIIWVGEGKYGCCADDETFMVLDQAWTEIASHRPVQWNGMRDYVTVYDRKK